MTEKTPEAADVGARPTRSTMSDPHGSLRVTKAKGVGNDDQPENMQRLWRHLHTILHSCTMHEM